jgi:5-formyltetrahydrofolate cyclo-ligase
MTSIINLPATMPPSGAVNPRQLRAQLRAGRRQLSLFSQAHASLAIHRRLQRSLCWQGARRIAFYRATDGEVNLAGLLQTAWSQNKQCFLPVLHPFKAGRLLFVQVNQGTPLYQNRWGIAEPKPVARRCISPAALHLVLLPLVGFDRNRQRLGMGKGYYDRAFAFRRQGRRHPRLVGVAHDCQEVTQGLVASPWDVQMDAVITSSKMLGSASLKT